jgi:HAD superfamily hydrolase (TIGR01549 family)
MKRFSCVIFDLDGTLTRTNELIYATFNHVAEKYVQKVFTPDEITGMFGPPEEVAVEKLVGKDRTEPAMQDYYAFYETHHPRLAEAYDGIREVLEFLKGNGVILAIFTGKGRRSALITLEAIGMTEYFDCIVTGDDVANYKPSPDGIRRVLRQFRLQPDEVLMVGDSVGDVRAAKEAGVAMAAVLWDSYGKDRVLETDASHFFHSVGEFSHWLKAAIPRNGESAN